MKILHYINNLGAGGAEKLLTDILPLIQEQGNEVHDNLINWLNHENKMVVSEN